MDRGKMVPDREAPPQKAEAPKPDYEGNPEVEAFTAVLPERRSQSELPGMQRSWVSPTAASASALQKHAGAAAAGRKLKLSLKLILMPPEILDYVVVHELAHRKQMNHSPLFWAEVEKVLPDYKARRAWLKENGRDY